MPFASCGHEQEVEGPRKGERGPSWRTGLGKGEWVPAALNGYCSKYLLESDKKRSSTSLFSRVIL